MNTAVYSVSVNRRHRRTPKKSARALTVYSAAAVVLIVLLILVFFGPKRTAASDNTILSYASVQIEQGDTLWSLAEKYAPAGISTRQYIRTVRSINSLPNDTIIAGYYLIIPIYTVPAD